LHVLKLPQASVATQERVIVELLLQLPPEVMSVYVMAGAGSQLSVAVADPVFVGKKEASQSMVIFAGQVITGAVASVIVISWV